MQIRNSTAQVSRELSPNSLIKIELLFGEQVEALEEKGERVKTRTTNNDAYEGYMDARHLVTPFETTHRISVRSATFYHEADFKNPIEGEPLYFNSLVKIEESTETPQGLMHKVVGGGWLFDTHIVPKEYIAPDFVEECMKFLGTSYGYERRGALIDCSTLVQAGCIATGRECPYDVKSGDMEKLGEPVELTEDLANLQRGDLVFWTEGKGSHVVIMVDSENGLHATIADPYRKCFIQPVKDVAKDQLKTGDGPITAIRRFADYAPA